VTRILAFGDSLTEGVVQPPATFQESFIFRPPPIDAGVAASYPYKLQALETARYTSQTITVLNGGAAGNRAAEDRQRLSTYVAATSPNVVLLMEGTNDLGDLIGTSGATLQNGITAVVNAMEDMVRDTQYRHVVPFVATIPSQRPGALRGGGAALVAPYNAALKVMIAKKGATLVDLNAQFPLSLIGQDGLHPTDAGYEKMAEIFQAALAASYEVPAASAASALRR